MHGARAATEASLLPAPPCCWHGAFQNIPRTWTWKVWYSTRTPTLPCVGHASYLLCVLSEGASNVGASREALGMVPRGDSAHRGLSSWPGAASGPGAQQGPQRDGSSACPRPQTGRIKVCMRAPLHVCAQHMCEHVCVCRARVHTHTPVYEHLSACVYAYVHTRAMEKGGLVPQIQALCSSEQRTSSRT